MAVGVATDSTLRGVSETFCPQLLQGLQCGRAVRKQIQACGGITGARYDATLDEILHPLGRHVQSVRQLGDSQPAGNATGMRLMAFLHQAMFEASVLTVLGRTWSRLGDR